MRPLILTIAIALTWPADLGARTWTSTDGNTIEDEFSDANRSFSTDVYHGETDGGEWEVLLYVLPAEDAKKLVAWVTESSALAERGEQDKIKPYDTALTAKAIHIASTKYYLEAN